MLREEPSLQQTLEPVLQFASLHSRLTAVKSEIQAIHSSTSLLVPDLRNLLDQVLFNLDVALTQCERHQYTVTSIFRHQLQSHLDDHQRPMMEADWPSHVG